MDTLKTPDLTPAQLVAAVAAVAAQLVNAALISGRVEHLVVGIAGIVVPLAWMIADAIIRHGRATGSTAAVAVATGDAAAQAKLTKIAELVVDDRTKKP